MSDYPTDADLELISKWEGNFEDLMSFIQSIWNWPDWGWRRSSRPRRRYKTAPLKRVYHISTGGWSGNEEIIRAMQGNWKFWMLCWEQSRHGGHYIFRVGDFPKETP